MNRIGIIGAMQIEVDLLLEKLLVKEEHTIAGIPFIKETTWIQKLLLRDVV